MKKLMGLYIVICICFVMYIGTVINRIALDIKENGLKNIVEQVWEGGSNRKQSNGHQPSGYYTPRNATYNRGVGNQEGKRIY